MKVLVIGISYKKTPIEVREKLSFSLRKKEIAYLQLKAKYGEVVILSTCNRSEIYVVTDDLIKAKKDLTLYLADFNQMKAEDLEGYLYFEAGKECLQHLFMVAGGLDSQVLGEDQILGQIKDALNFAHDYQSVGKVLDQIFRKSIVCGKKIREKTKISQHPTSISYTAVKYLEKIHGSLAGKTVMLVGAGKMNKLTMQYLLERKVKKIFIANRTFEQAKILEDAYEQLTVILFKELEFYLQRCDLVISCTAAPHLVIDEKQVINIKKEIVFLDLAVPRDIDPSISALPGMSLIDLDDLESQMVANQSARAAAAEQGKIYIQEALAEMEEWGQIQPFVPVLQKIEGYHHNMLETELPKVVNRLKNMEDDEKIERILRSLVKKIYTRPMLAVKKMIKEESIQDYKEMQYILNQLYEES